jgi:hypothetical protein
MNLQRYIIIIILLFLVPYAHAIPISFDIKDLYIEAQGNNPEEAKLKAKSFGVERAFAIMVDKIGLANPGVENLPYEVMADTVQDIKYKNQKSTQKEFAAFADYIFDYDKLEALIYQHSDPSILNKLNQCLVIPAIRQGRKIFVFDNSVEWIKMWSQSQEMLRQYRVILLSQQDVPNLNGKNILNLTYDQLRNLMQMNRTHKAVLVIAQYYTDLDTGNASLKVEYRYMSAKDVNIKQEEFALPETTQSKLIIKKIIDSFITENGKAIDPKLERNKSRIPQNIFVSKDSIQTGAQEIIVSFEVYHQEEWNDMQKDLETIGEIKNIKIVEQQGNLVTFIITYKSSMQNLINDMYPKKIGYVKRGDKYFIIRINDGI